MKQHNMFRRLDLTMRATFQGFEAARRGILTAQKGLDITGHNMANMYTPGYTRQRVDQQSIVTQTSSARYASTSIDATGQGSNIAGVSQTRDKFLDKRFREQYGEVGYYQQSSNILSDIESALNEKSSGLLDAISGKNGIISSLQDLTKNADNETYANITQVNFQKMCQLLHQFSNKLDEVESQQKYDLKNSVSFVNETIKKIADLNKTIAEDVGISRINDNEYYGPNELMDRRNLLIDELSQYADVEVTNLSNGSTNIKMNGKMVIEHKETTQILYNDGGDSDEVRLTWMDDGKAVVLTKGSLKAATDYINGVGPGRVYNADQSPERGIPYYKQKLDTFAQNLAYQMNNAIKEKTKDAAGVVTEHGNKFLMGASQYNDATKKYETSSDITKVTAANIAISDKWALDASYIKPLDMQMKNTEILGLIDTISGTTGVAFHTSFSAETAADGTVTYKGNGQDYKGSFMGFVEDYTTSLGTDVSYNNGRVEAMAVLTDDLNNRRGSISDVAEAEETSNMMIYSKAFQASSRLMTALDEALDVVINKMGMVGR